MGERRILVFPIPVGDANSFCSLKNSCLILNGSGEIGSRFLVEIGIKNGSDIAD
jgi:hypothetical protein